MNTTKLIHGGIDFTMEIWQETETDDIGSFIVHKTRITTKEYPPVEAHSIFSEDMAIGRAFQKFHENLTK